MRIRTVLVTTALLVAGLLIQPTAASAARKTPVSSCANGYVALTIDDSPFGTTSNMLTALRRNGLRATFFVLGSRVEERPDLAVRMVNEKHWIGNHTWDHSDLTTLSYEGQLDQLTRTQEIVKSVTGVTPDLFRPTYLNWNDDTVAAATSLGLSFSIPTIDTYDWDEATTAQIVAAVSTARNGDVIMLHDRYSSTQNATVKAVPGIAKTLRSAKLCSGRVSPETGLAVAP